MSVSTSVSESATLRALRCDGKGGRGRAGSGRAGFAGPGRRRKATGVMWARVAKMIPTAASSLDRGDMPAIGDPSRGFACLRRPVDALRLRSTSLSLCLRERAALDAVGVNPAVSDLPTAATVWRSPASEWWPESGVSRSPSFSSPLSIPSGVGAGPFLRQSSSSSLHLSLSSSARLSPGKRVLATPSRAAPAVP